MLSENVEYFTEKEAEKRDKIVKGYFDTSTINNIVNEVASNLQNLPQKSAVLDVGAGTGFFTTKIAKRLSKRDLNFYAFDATPAMLNMLAKKLHKLNEVAVTPILGIAERINESLTMSRKAYKPLGVTLPLRFDAVISILILHHCVSLPEVLGSMKKSSKAWNKISAC